MRLTMTKHAKRALVLLVLGISTVVTGLGQPTSAARERGSQTAKKGFLNETEIAAKFNAWKTDPDARAWLALMGYKLETVDSVRATKPHGEKSDVDVWIKTAAGEKREGISIKLVSNPAGFNQIDKRWLRQYAKLWNMPQEVEAALKYFLGEVVPFKSARNPQRMFLNELDAGSQKAVVDFFSTNKEKIISDLIEGDGSHPAGWLMVALKATENTRWILRRSSDAIRFFGDGPVEITRQGNLRIGRVTMQRKGGDGGRETAKMLQFKINPAQLFELK